MQTHEGSMRDDPQLIGLQPVDDDVLSIVSSMMLDPPGQETGEQDEERVQQLESHWMYVRVGVLEKNYIILNYFWPYLAVVRGQSRLFWFCSWV